MYELVKNVEIRSMLSTSVSHSSVLYTSAKCNSVFTDTELLPFETMCLKNNRTRVTNNLFNFKQTTWFSLLKSNAFFASFSSHFYALQKGFFRSLLQLFIFMSSTNSKPVTLMIFLDLKGKVTLSKMRLVVLVWQYPIHSETVRAWGCYEQVHCHGEEMVVQ